MQSDTHACKYQFQCYRQFTSHPLNHRHITAHMYLLVNTQQEHTLNKQRQTNSVNQLQNNTMLSTHDYKLPLLYGVTWFQELSRTRFIQAIVPHSKTNTYKLTMDTGMVCSVYQRDSTVNSLISCSNELSTITYTSTSRKQTVWSMASFLVIYVYITYVLVLYFINGGRQYLCNN